MIVYAIQKIRGNGNSPNSLNRVIAIYATQVLKLRHTFYGWNVLPVIKAEPHLSRPLGYLHVKPPHPHLCWMGTPVCLLVLDHIRRMHVCTTAWSLRKGGRQLLQD